MPRRAVDLSSHLNQTVEAGHPADFPISLKPLMYRDPRRDLVHVPQRWAVVRSDLGRAIALEILSVSLLAFRNARRCPRAPSPDADARRAPRSACE